MFLISLKAGGVGLTLTEADYVFVLDPWWNPAVEAQAVDRAHRIGQQRPVIVYRLVAAGTIEEKVMELKARKAALFAQVLDGATAPGAGPRSTPTTSGRCCRSDRRARWSGDAGGLLEPHELVVEVGQQPLQAGAVRRQPVSPKLIWPSYDVQVMFMACPWYGTDSGYMPSSWAPFM